MTSTLCPQPSCLLLVQVPSGVDPALEEQQRHPLQSCPGRQRTDTTVLSSERLAGAWGPVGHRVCPWTWPHALSLDGAGDCFRGWDVPAEWVASSTGQKPSREPMKTRVAWRRGPALSSFLPAPGPRPTAQVTGRSAAPELQQGRFQGLGQRQASAHRQPRPARFLRMVNTQTLLRFTFCSLLSPKWRTFSPLFSSIAVRRGPRKPSQCSRSWCTSPSASPVLCLSSLVLRGPTMCCGAGG